MIPFAITLVVLQGFACLAPFTEEKMVQTFLEQIGTIDRKVVDLTATSDLLADPCFQSIFASPSAHMEEALATMSYANVSDQQKKIVVYGMQRLAAADYLTFAGRLLDLGDAGRLSSDILEAVFFPGFEWSTYLAENYDKPAENRLLNRAARCSALNRGYRRLITEYILTGRARAQVRELRRSAQIP
jgi:hypothetical protein